MDINQQLQQTPNWLRLNAYERAKICCQLLSTLGQPIPSWMQLRQWIGKGSANDIHRAKQDFLSERQQVSAELIHQDDMPTQLSGSLQEWWQQLKQAAEQEYSLQKQQWQQEKIELQQQFLALQNHIEQQHQAIEQLQQQLESCQKQYQQAQQDITLKEQLASQHAIEYQQLVTLAKTQQTTYITAQQQQHTQQLADQQQQQFLLDQQMKVLADFHGFAAQQIDLARQQHDQQHTLLLELVQQILCEQAKQQPTEPSWLTIQQAQRARLQHRQKLFRF